MKKILAALALFAFIASPAVAPRYLPSYDCAPTDYDSSGAQVATYCE